MVKRNAIFPGSFDPPTVGHASVIAAAAELFDELTVAPIDNMNKKSSFTVDARLDMLKKITAVFAGIKVVTFDNMLLADFMRENGIKYIIKGLRTTSDFEYEIAMASINKRLNENVQTVFIPSSDENICVSSSTVREIVRLNGDIKGLVPDEIIEIVKGSLR